MFRPIGLTLRASSIRYTAFGGLFTAVRSPHAPSLASGPPASSIRYTAFGGLFTAVRSPHAPSLASGPHCFSFQPGAVLDVFVEGHEHRPIFGTGRRCDNHPVG